MHFALMKTSGCTSHFHPSRLHRGTAHLGKDAFFYESRPAGKLSRENEGNPPFGKEGLIILYRSGQGAKDLSFELGIWVSCSAAHLGICRVSFHDGNRANTSPCSNEPGFPAEAHQDTILQEQ